MLTEDLKYLAVVDIFCISRAEVLTQGRFAPRGTFLPF